MLAFLSKYRIPTLIGLAILIAGAGAGIWAVSRGQTALFPRAAAEFTPKQVRITNVAEGGWSISWITDEATVGWVKLGTAADKLDQVIGDDRDQKSGGISDNLTHQVTIRNLRPATNYWFKLGSGPGKRLYDNQGQAYRVTTAAGGSKPPAADTAYGTVVTAAGEPAKGAIVYVQLPQATPLSTLVQDNGNWLVALSTARTSDLSAYAQYDLQTATVEILVQSGKGDVTTATVTTANDSPVPTLTLGKTYDLREQSGTNPDNQVSSPIESKFSLEATGGGDKVTWLNPAKEDAVITASRPAFLGKGPAGTTLNIKVESEQTYTATVKVKSDGSWEWTPPAGLSPGEHTISVSFTDSQGKQQSAKRNFIVAAASSGLPAFTASPSATATPSPTASPSGRQTMPSTASGVPQPGTLTPTLALVILGVTLLGWGMWLQLKRDFLPYE